MFALTYLDIITLLYAGYSNTSKCYSIVKYPVSNDFYFNNKIVLVTRKGGD